MLTLEDINREIAEREKVLAFAKSQLEKAEMNRVQFSQQVGAVSGAIEELNLLKKIIEERQKKLENPDGK